MSEKIKPWEIKTDRCGAVVAVGPIEIVGDVEDSWIRESEPGALARIANLPVLEAQNKQMCEAIKVFLERRRFYDVSNQDVKDDRIMALRESIRGIE